MRLAIGLALALAWGCATGMKTDVTYDPEASFGAWETWAWVPNPDPAGGTRLDPRLVGLRVREAVQAELSGRGYRELDAQRADFLVTWRASVARDAAGAPVTRLPSGGSSRAFSPYAQGTLVLDVIDRRSGDLVWRGMAEAPILADDTPVERASRIGSAVETLLSGFPPGR